MTDVPYQAYRSKRHSRSISAHSSSVASSPSSLSLDERPSLTHESPLPASTSAVRPKSTVRRVPLRNSRSQLPSSPLGLRSAALSPSHSPSPSVDSTPSSSGAIRLPVIDKPLPPPSTTPGPILEAHTSPQKLTKSVSQVSSANLAKYNNGPNGTVAAATHTISLAAQPVVPYRPGFQPRGLNRSLTDDFTALRCTYQNGEGPHMTKRVERTKLERRLEKLISLHFPPDLHVEDEKIRTKQDPGEAEKRLGSWQRRKDLRRFSSTFDFDSIRSMDAGSIWKSMLAGRTSDSLREAEQRITPWQDDSAVTRCPLCSTTFHPLTNRKHHCRLCGKVICALLPKWPHRPVTCSLLFVLDPNFRMIEEVDEGVDYGVKRKGGSKPRRESTIEIDGDGEQFLKGVRICRECRPVLLRRKFHQESSFVPSFVRLHNVLKDLEHEIEAALPQFQKLVLSLSHNDVPLKEASASRKRLLEAFTEYDVLSKRIYQLHCPDGTRDTQQRIQSAILTHANIFLQKNMFPLKALRTGLPKPDSLDCTTPHYAEDLELAKRLQPLLEQEAQLEAFIGEAEARRKFEDIRALRSNLDEVRVEIQKISRSASLVDSKT